MKTMEYIIWFCSTLYELIIFVIRNNCAGIRNSYHIQGYFSTSNNHFPGIRAYDS